MTLILTIVILLLVVIIASIGVLFKRQPIKGSCGGLTALGFEKACACKEPCDQAKEFHASQELKKRKQDPNYKNPFADIVTDPDAEYAQARKGEGVYRAKDSSESASSK